MDNPNTKTKYYWSFDENADIWYNRCDSIEECLEEARKEIVVGCVYIGIMESPYLPKEVDSENIIHELRTDAFDKCGECSYGWLEDVPVKDSDVLEKMMKETVIKWLEKTGNLPMFGSFDKIWEYNIETGMKISGEGKLT